MKRHPKFPVVCVADATFSRYLDKLTGGPRPIKVRVMAADGTYKPVELTLPN